ncbi:MAG: hypothetical protein K0U79_06915 [Gammaproteobacteria bacterium]|nr:hypothetical protein [Gammaproteobacteria bacterium]
MNRSMTPSSPTGYPSLLLRMLCAAALFASIQACGGGGGGDDDGGGGDGGGGGGGGDELNRGLEGVLYFDDATDYIAFDPSEGEVDVLRNGTGDGSTPSADSQEFVAIDSDSATGDTNKQDIVTFKRNGNETGRIALDEFLNGYPKLSPNGTFIIEARDFGEQTLVLDRNGAVIKEYGEGIEDYAWTPDGRLVLVDGESIVITDMSFNIDTSLRSFDGLEPSSVSVSPDGERIAFSIAEDGASRRHVWTMDIDGSSPQQITSSLVGETSPRWSPDGKTLSVRKGSASGAGCPELWAVEADADTADLADDSDAAFRLVKYDDDGDVRGVCAFSPAFWRAS